MGAPIQEGSPMRKTAVAPGVLTTLFVGGPVLMLSISAAQAPTTAVPSTAVRTALIPQLVARQHLAKRVPPLQGVGAGVVYVDVRVSPSGRVEQAKALCGSAVYRERVEDAVLEWEFQPFTSSGQAVSARTVITEISRTAPTTADDLAALAPFGDTMLMCKASIDSRDVATSEKVCGELAATADKRMGKFEQACTSVLLAWSHINAGRGDEAIKQADRAVSKLSGATTFTDDPDEIAREAARVRAKAGRYDDAVKQYEKSLKGIRQSYENPRSEFKAIIGKRLRSVLTEYIDLLDQAGKQDEARKVREERDRVK
jgi:tetratricopeptide (TPR) repeat protein